MSKRELSWGIAVQVERHLQDAVRGNFRRFFALDKVDRNGQVEWSEWIKDFKEKIASKYDGEIYKNFLFIKVLYSGTVPWWVKDANIENLLGLLAYNEGHP